VDKYNINFIVYEADLLFYAVVQQCEKTIVITKNRKYNVYEN